MPDVKATKNPVAVIAIATSCFLLGMLMSSTGQVKSLNSELSDKGTEIQRLERELEFLNERLLDKVVYSFGEFNRKRLDDLQLEALYSHTKTVTDCSDIADKSHERGCRYENSKIKEVPELYNELVRVYNSKLDNLKYKLIKID